MWHAIKRAEREKKVSNEGAGEKNADMHWLACMLSFSRIYDSDSACHWYFYFDFIIEHTSRHFSRHLSPQLPLEHARFISLHKRAQPSLISTLILTFIPTLLPIFNRAFNRHSLFYNWDVFILNFHRNFRSRILMNLLIFPFLRCKILNLHFFSVLFYKKEYLFHFNSEFVQLYSNPSNFDHNSNRS